ncbi:hypothetical protein ACIBJI_24540 [Nocardia sp. NPDC050408]|uniref:hypothetical protein n=1 Tax=Nocardia sp. NPDC050408 TaxID=3364319 RepID=UPI0037BD48B5
MTGPGSARRVGDIAAEQAAMLHRVHQLAAEAARLQHNVKSAANNSATRIDILAQIVALDRDRDLTETQARARGVPRSWVDLARRVGQTGGAWTDEQLLPTPRPKPKRRSIARVIADTTQLTDMAAITVAREHLLATNGVTGEPEPAAAQQVRRNMQALWTRAAATATSIGMGRTQRAHTFHTAIGDLEQRLGRYLQYSLEDLDPQWRSYSTPTIAAAVRRSLTSLRRADRDTNSSNNGTDAEQPPTPKALLQQALHALHTTLVDRSGSQGAEINAAITEALPPTTSYGWDCAIDTLATETNAPDPHCDAGPDP